MLTVSETAISAPDEDGPSMNSPKTLSMEATFINHNFSQQVALPFLFNTVYVDIGYM